MRIVAITTSRADWNGLGIVCRALQDAGHHVFVVVTGQHTEQAKQCGDGFSSEGIPIWAWIDLERRGDGPRDAVFRGTQLADELAESFILAGPVDLALINGDRYEALAAAYACSVMGVPIAHLSGGDVTAGSQDDAYRHAITALSALHFPTNERAFERLARAIPFSTITMTGAPEIDRICSTPVMTRDAWLVDFALADNEVNPLVIFHPETRSSDPLRGMDAMFAALARIEKPMSAIVVSPNADPGGQEVLKRLLDFSIGRSHRFHANLEPARFYACMTYCDFMIGNSSAGVHEAPVFGLPVVNIGERQKGRLKARNVIDVDATEDDISWGITCALAARRINIQSPYGDGHACERIVKAIRAWGDERAPR